MDAAGVAEAEFVVVDNGSGGSTAQLGTEHGAHLVNEPKQGASESKLSETLLGTVRAGWKILWAIAKYTLSSGR